MDADYTLFDVSDFPLVRFVGTTEAGYAARWCAEMDRLIAHAAPFALIYPPRGEVEDHGDRVMRGQWLKRNKAPLATLCRIMVTVEPDPARRAELEAMFPALVTAFGARQATRATRDEAEMLARHLLAGGTLDPPI